MHVSNIFTYLTTTFLSYFVPFYTIKDGGQLGGGPEQKINISEVVNRSLANFNQNNLKVRK
jgi:hypothetical protein